MTTTTSDPIEEAVGFVLAHFTNETHHLSPAMRSAVANELLEVLAQIAEEEAMNAAALN